MTVFRYSIPILPDSLNKYAGRQNVWEYRQKKQGWKQIVNIYCRPKPPKPFEKATVKLHYIFPDGRRRDPDNYAGKMVLDGLVAAGILKDDSFNCIELTLSAETQKGVEKLIIEVSGL